jgi:predicted RND superfamily exporter protein
LTGCKTTKESLNVKAEVKTELKTNVVEQTDSSSNESVHESLNELINNSDSISVKEVTVKLSKPDSLGKQYPEEITYKETVKKGTHKKETNRVRDSTSQKSVTKVTTDHSVLNTDSQVMVESNKKTKARVPKITWLVIILIVVTGFFVLRRFKRFNPFRL